MNSQRLADSERTSLLVNLGGRSERSSSRAVELICIEIWRSIGIYIYLNIGTRKRKQELEKKAEAWRTWDHTIGWLYLANSRLKGAV